MQSQWLLGDGVPPAGFEFVVDGGLRLSPAISALISSVTGSTYLTPLSNAFPYYVAQINWGGTDDHNVEIMRIKANLHPNRDGSGKTVVWWKCQLFHVSHVWGNFVNQVTHPPYLLLTPMTAALQVAATGDTVGDVLFDFSTLAVRPKPKSFPAATYEGIKTDLSKQPTTLVFVWGVKADGSAATNVGWTYDNGITTFGTGNVLKTATLVDTYTALGITKSIRAGTYGWDMTGGDGINGGSIGVPKLIVETGAFVASTITFSGAGNRLDLLATPTGSVYLAGLADTPPGTSVTYEIRNDADSAWVAFLDGQTFADLTLTAMQTRKIRATLTPNGAGNLTPTLRRLGMEEKTVVDLSHVAEITDYQCHVDPVTLEGRITTATLKAVKNGVRDFRSAIEDLLTTYDLATLEFRWYCGDTKLAHSQWTLLDIFPVIDDFTPEAASVGIELLGANALISANLPKYDVSGAGVETPDSVVTNPGLWTDQAGGAVNIYTTIDELQSDDTDYVRSPATPANAVVEFGLSNLADPARDTGHFVDIRLKKDSAGGDLIDLVIEFRQAAVIKMTYTITNIPSEWTDYSLALTAAQAQSISDYTDLRIRVSANVVTPVTARRCYISWMQMRVTGQRGALVYDNLAANLVYDDLLSQAEVPARYKGQNLTNTTVLSRTLTNTNALAEAKNVTALFGKSVVSSRGAIQVVDMFSPQAAAVAFRQETILPLRISPGFRERRPFVSVLWNWNEAKNRFDDEVTWQSTPALTKLGKARVDAQEKWNEDSSKYLYTESVAKDIANRTGTAIGTGLILWKFRSRDPYPELEVGDVVSIETSRFLAKDPQSTRSLRGRLSAIAHLTDTTYSNGFWEYTGWVQSYADILAAPAVNYRVNEKPTIAASVVSRGDHLYALWAGDSKVLSVKVATSTSTFPAAGTGTSVDGQSGEYDAGAITYAQGLYATITPYTGLGGTGIKGDATFLKFRLPHIETLVDFTTGKVLRSTAFNNQGSLLTFVSPLAGTFFSYATGGPAGPQMWISFGWTTQSLYLPDGSTATVPNPPAAPAAPTTGTTVLGALGARTLYVKVAYCKTDPITGHESLYPVSAETTQAVAANSVLTVTALADPGNGLYDGWAVLVGNATGVNYVQGGTAKKTFGVNYTEAAGGFSTTQNSLWTASWKSITKIGLDPTTTYKHYPYWDIAKNFVYIPAETTNVSPQLAQLQNGDGVLSLGQYGTAQGFSGVVSLATPAAAATTVGNAGGGRLT